MKAIDGVLCLLLAAVMAVGMLVFSARSDSARANLEELKKQAIDHGYAEHDRLTGEWQWLEETKTKEVGDE